MAKAKAKSKTQTTDRKIKGEITRLDAPRGSYLAQRLLAVELADELAEKAKTPLELLYLNCNSALKAAIKIAMYSRNNAPDPRDFIAQQVRLSEYIVRSKQDDVYHKWPKSPGHSLSWRVGESALHTAFIFADMVHTAVIYARNRVGAVKLWEGFIINGWTSYDLLPVVPEPDPAFAQWMERAMNELHTHTLPPVDRWATWDIHREAGIIHSHMTDELELASKIVTPENDMPINETEGAILTVLLEKNAIDSDRRKIASEIAPEAIGKDGNSIKRPVNHLATIGLIKTMQGGGGGMWLTSLGIDRAKRLQKI